MIRGLPRARSGRQRRTGRDPRLGARHEPRERRRMAGYEVGRGQDRRRAATSTSTTCERRLDETSPALMLTNPNTLGLFERADPRDRRARPRGAARSLYCDGANLNAILGMSRPGDMGFDVVHFNPTRRSRRRTAAAGPGAGPVGGEGRRSSRSCRRRCVTRRDDGTLRARLRPPAVDRPLQALPRQLRHAGARLRLHPHARAADGLRDVAETAVLNANYSWRGSRDVYDVPFDRTCMHEFVLSARTLKREHGVRALDIAKRLHRLRLPPADDLLPADRATRR